MVNCLSEPFGSSLIALVVKRVAGEAVLVSQVWLGFSGKLWGLGHFPRSWLTSRAFINPL